MENFENYINQFNSILSNTVITTNNEALNTDNGFKIIVEEILKIKEKKGTVYLIGNGGSSGIISHASIDFINACKIKANPITDNSILTCLANDYGYENVFSEALSTLITSNDLLIAVSSSGNSKNIINGVKTANKSNAKSITLSGFKNSNPLREEGDYNLWLNSNSYGFAEIGHALLLHYITDSIVFQLK